LRKIKFLGNNKTFVYLPFRHPISTMGLARSLTQNRKIFINKTRVKQDFITVCVLLIIMDVKKT